MVKCKSKTDGACGNALTSGFQLDLSVKFKTLARGCVISYRVAEMLASKQFMRYVVAGYSRIFFSIKISIKQISQSTQIIRMQFTKPERSVFSLVDVGLVLLFSLLMISTNIRARTALQNSCWNDPWHRTTENCFERISAQCRTRTYNSRRRTVILRIFEIDCTAFRLTITFRYRATLPRSEPNGRRSCRHEFDFYFGAADEP